MGEQSGKDLYLTLLFRAYAPRFLRIEGSVNPLPYLGTYINDLHPNFYEDAQVTGNLNWVQTITWTILQQLDEADAVSLERNPVGT